MSPIRITLAVVAALAVLTGVFLAGRASAPARPTDDRYVAGLQAGEAQGREEGRAGQEAASLTGPAAARVRQAFRDGYAAGANDVFAGYDGGWALGAYVVSIVRGTAGITYRIASREQLHPGLDYYLCRGPSGICQRRHR
jgi:hypothetical protein